MTGIFYTHWAADPYFNMAFDDCMLAHVIHRPDNVLLRLYTWSPGAITIGYHQDAERAVDHNRLGTTPVVRRITGGRAVYHDVSELTYAIACRPEAIGLAGDGRVSEVYTRLATLLGLFLRNLGVASDLVPRSTGGSGAPDFFHKAPCFASKARYELQSQGRKIVASAQRQLEGAILQHGSIKLSGLARHPALDGLEDSVQPLAEKHLRRLAETFVAVMSEQLGLEFGARSVVDAISAGAVVHQKAIAQMPLERRDIVKQLLEPNSL